MGVGIGVQRRAGRVNVIFQPIDSVFYLFRNSLEEAIPGFREFLQGQGWPDQVQWLASGTVLPSKKGYYWIKSRKSEEGMNVARETYQEGVVLGLGISLEALCNSGSLTFAYVLRPVDRDEAERLFIRDLKLSVPLNPQPARVVKSSFALVDP